MYIDEMMYIYSFQSKQGSFGFQVYTIYIYIYIYIYMDVSENSGTPKSSISIGFSIINHPFWGTGILGNTHIDEMMNPKIKTKSWREVLREKTRKHHD